MNKKEKIDRKMTIESIFNLFPEKSQKLAQELTNAGLSCVGCQAATWESLENGFLGHGWSEKQIEEMVDKLNAILEEEVDLETITLTSIAAEKYRSILKEQNKAGWGIRLFEKAAGCSGFEYVLDFCEKGTEEDESFLSQNISIYVKKAMLSRLRGCVIDYVDGLHASGFKITNPNAKSSCGCGSSHGY